MAYFDRSKVVICFIELEKTCSLYCSECFTGWVNTEGWNDDNHAFTDIRLFL